MVLLFSILKSILSRKTFTLTLVYFYLVLLRNFFNFVRSEGVILIQCTIVYEIKPAFNYLSTFTYSTVNIFLKGFQTLKTLQKEFRVKIYTCVWFLFCISRGHSDFDCQLLSFYTIFVISASRLLCEERTSKGWGMRNSTISRLRANFTSPCSRRVPQSPSPPLSHQGQ